MTYDSTNRMFTSQLGELVSYLQYCKPITWIIWIIVLLLLIFFAFHKHRTRSVGIYISMYQAFFAISQKNSNHFFILVVISPGLWNQLVWKVFLMMCFQHIHHICLWLASGSDDFSHHILTTPTVTILVILCVMRRFHVGFCQSVLG